MTASRLETWRWIDPLKEDGFDSMERDRELFRQVKNGESFPVLRFYTWLNPSLSYGRTQGIESEVALQAREKGWSVVQRPTGGGKVLHGDDLCFSLIWRKETSGISWKVRDSYCNIHLWLKKCLERMGMETVCAQKVGKVENRGWCFLGPVEQDLIWRGKKIAGGAQWRDGNCALHQGSIQMPPLTLSLSPRGRGEGEGELFKETFCEMFSANFVPD